MCKGSDILKVAAVAAAVYTGGASMGLFGAAEGTAAAAGGFDALTAADAAAGAAGTSLAAGATGAETISAMGAAETAAGATSAAAGAYGTGGVATGGTSSTSGAATGANTWLQTAKTVAPFVSAAGSALTGVAALAGSRARIPGQSDVPLLGAQPGAAPDIYATLKRKNALLFGGSGAESTDLGGGSAPAPSLGRNTLLGS